MEIVSGGATTISGALDDGSGGALLVGLGESCESGMSSDWSSELSKASFAVVAVERVLIVTLLRVLFEEGSMLEAGGEDEFLKQALPPTDLSAGESDR